MGLRKSAVNYFYEKTDLARQKRQWTQTIQLYKDAEIAEFKPLTDAEWLPLVEAHIQTNEIDKAVEITTKITNVEKYNTAGFCQLWIKANENENVLPYSEDVLTMLKCRE